MTGGWPPHEGAPPRVPPPGWAPAPGSGGYGPPPGWPPAPTRTSGPPQPPAPSWAQLAPPMRPVDDVRTGYSETYWRAEQGAAARVAGQRWGLPAAAMILGFNLLAFVLAPHLLTRITAAVYVLATITPTVVAAAAVLVLSSTRGNGPVVDLGLPRSAAELYGYVRTGLGWGLLALGGGLAVGWLILAGSDATPTEALTGAPVLPLGWRVAFAAWIVLGAPLGEELLFRGLLWGALEKRRGRVPLWWSWLGNRWVVLVVTAVLFAVWHREWWRLPVLVVGGLMLGVARMRSGSVVASATAHSVNNTLPALGVVFAPLLLT